MSSCNCTQDFEITGGRQMKTFLGMQVEQTAQSIKIHLDHYIKEVLACYVEYIRKAIRPKKVPIAPNVILRPEDTHLICRIPVNRSSTVLLWQSFSSQPHGSDSISPLVRLCGVTAGSVLRIGWIFALGSASPPHGILGRHPQL